MRLPHAYAFFIVAARLRVKTTPSLIPGYDHVTRNRLRRSLSYERA